MDDSSESIARGARLHGRTESRITRRSLLRRTAAAAGVAAAGGAAVGVDRLLGGGSRTASLPSFQPASPGATLRFPSRPDLKPPLVSTSGGVSPGGYLLLGPGSTGDTSQQGPMMIGGTGELIWFRPVAHGLWATNLAASTHRNSPVLFWWEGKVIAPGFGQGEAVIVDSAYREVRRVRAGNGRQMDLHEFQLTPDGTALFTCYPQIVPMDLSSIGGPSDGRVQESVFQEVDLSSGRVLLEWHSLDHIPVTESYKPLGEPFDYLHVNSIDLAPDGNLLISARHTWALYKVDRRTGEIIWRLGGKRSDFAMETDARFSWQHDARVVSPSAITLFDDGSDGPTTTESQSRGLVLAVDEARRTVRAGRSYRHPRSLLSSAMGSVQSLPDGHVLVGWGTAPYTSEFGADGTLLDDAALPAHIYSYRARRSPWNGKPADAPAIQVDGRRTAGARTLYVSWNGATEVAHWNVHRGNSRAQLTVVGTAVRRGFETAIRVTGGGYAALAAVDRSGNEVARTRAVRL